MYLWEQLVLESFPDNSVTECEKIVIVMNIVSRKKTNTTPTNFTNTASINFHSKKLRYFYITIFSIQYYQWSFCCW